MKKLIYRLSYMVVGMTLVISGYLMGGEHSIASATTLAPSAKTVTTYVTKKAVDMKAGKHKKNKTLNTIPKGKTVTHVKSYGSWTQVKYGSKTGYVPTSSLGNKKTVTVKPAPKPTTRLTPSQKDELMKTVYSSKGNYIYGLSFYVKSTGENKHLGEGILSQSKTTGSGLWLDGKAYKMSIYITPEDFGKNAYEIGKEIYKKYNKGILIFGEAELGKSHAESFRKEFESFTKNSKGSHTPVIKTIGGKKVTFAWDGFEYSAQIK